MAKAKQDNEEPHAMTQAEEVGLERLVEACIKIRDKKAEITSELNGKLEALDTKLKAFKASLDEHCQKTGAKSMAFECGSFYRSVKTKYWTSDWESMGKFIVENEATDLLERRIHQGNMKSFLEENPEKLPPNLNAESEYTITVRRKK